MKTYDPKAFDWHHDALAHIEAGGSARDPAYPKIFTDTAMTGAYAYKPSKSEAPKPVYFFYSTKEEGKLLCKISGEFVKYGLDIWPSCAVRPISRAVYDAVIAGEGWPSEVTVTMADGSTDSTLTRGVGHNSGDGPDALKGNVQEWVDRAKKAIKLGAPTTQAEADSLADIKTKLGDLLSDAEKAREAETAPLYRVWKDTSEKWTSWITPAKPYLSNLQTLINAFIKAESDRRAAEARRMNEAAAAAEAAKAPAGREGGGAVLSAPTPTVEPVRVAVGTRKVLKQATKRVVVFDDFAQAAAFFCTMETVAEPIRRAITDKAMALLSNDIAVPGARLEKEIVGR